MQVMNPVINCCPHQSKVYQPENEAVAFTATHSDVMKICLVFQEYHSMRHLRPRFTSAEEKLCNLVSSFIPLLPASFLADADSKGRKGDSNSHFAQLERCTRHRPHSYYCL